LPELCSHVEYKFLNNGVRQTLDVSVVNMFFCYAKWEKRGVLGVNNGLYGLFPFFLATTMATMENGA